VRRRAWIDELLTKRTRIETALGAPLGKMLGCGHFGCVFESTPPWVVKFSIDPTEGPIWSKIVGLINEEAYGALGFPEIKSITRLTPDVPYGGRKKKVWAIVREGVEPVYRTSAELYTDFSRAKFGLPVGSGRFDRIGGDSQLPEDFLSAIYGLSLYQTYARAWHAFTYSPRRSSEYSRTLRAEYHSRDAVEMKIEGILNREFHGPLAGGLGESLSMLASNGVYLRDVHRGNIGWHVAAPGDGNDWDRLVIFDPGHTPTGPATDIPEALIENGRDPL
jgi:hypothetical protein